MVKPVIYFSGRNKIVIYDLTNMHFEGQMNGSEKAAFGRSKQKRNDRKLIGLSLAIDSNGFCKALSVLCRKHKRAHHI